MKKLRESGLLKFIAGILLGLGLIAGIVSGIFTVGAVSEDYYGVGGKERLKESIIEEIAWFYNSHAVEYCAQKINSEYDDKYEWDEKFYENLFAEENTNYMFSVTTPEGKELLSNYYVDDVQYKGQIETNISVERKEEVISCQINVTDIVRPVEYADLPDYAKEQYEEGVWYYYSIPNTVEYYDGDVVGYVDDSQPDSTSVTVDMSDVTAVTVDTVEMPDATEVAVDAAGNVVNDPMNPTTAGETTAVTVDATTEIAPEEIIGVENPLESAGISNGLEIYKDSEGVYYYVDEYGVLQELISEEYYTQGELAVEEAMEQYEAEENKNRIICAYSHPLNLNNLYVYGNGNDIYINVDNTIDYRLADNSKYQFVYDNLMNKTKDYDYVYRANWDYDTSTGIYTEKYDCGNYQDIILTYYVKSELSAYDHFAMSYRLKYMTQIYDAALPVFVVCCVIILISFAYLVWAAGHKKNVEGIAVSGFDKIPYDVVLVVYGIAALFGLFLIAENGYSLRSMLVLSIPLCIVVMLFPVLLNTTAVRFKVGSVLKNTVTVKVLKWIWKCVKKFFGQCKSLFGYLRENMNIVWKWVVGFVALGIFEFFLCMAFSDIESVVMLLIIDFLVIGTVLVIAGINMNKLKEGAKKIAAGNVGYKLDTDHMLWEFKKHGETLNSINDGISVAVNERLKSEHMQTELITNVTHDIKTPLTSIISYVDLLSKEKLNNEKADEYVEVLSRQSERLKKLIDDLIEASKATTGNLKVEFADVDVKVLLEQSLGEFSDKLEAKGLKPVVNFHTDDTVVRADGKHLWRVFDNLINNISKYAQDNTRVYVDVERVTTDETIDGMTLDDIVKNSYAGNSAEVLKVSFKNISKEELNISGEELMQRFVRGDKSRNTEGNGLGLSIAKSLMKLQDGDLQIIVDGDLFKVILILK
ncbi:MAG: HAMP domain-containing histidine kinase [Lachnospiraceae bacterium]|nr:HAMP domain-containing histidine kinase [Lachnospiraceae bacterium]